MSGNMKRLFRTLPKPMERIETENEMTPCMHVTRYRCISDVTLCMIFIRLSQFPESMGPKSYLCVLHGKGLDTSKTIVY